MSYYYSSSNKSLDVEGTMFYLDRATAMSKCLAEFENIKSGKRRCKKQMPYSAVIQVIGLDGKYATFHAIKFDAVKPKFIKLKPEKPFLSSIDIYWVPFNEENLGVFEGGIAAGKDVINYEQLIKDIM